MILKFFFFFLSSSRNGNASSALSIALLIMTSSLTAHTYRAAPSATSLIPIAENVLLEQTAWLTGSTVEPCSTQD